MTDATLSRSYDVFIVCVDGVLVSWYPTRYDMVNLPLKNKIGYTNRLMI
jgi:hypothetical protein